MPRRTSYDIVLFITTGILVVAGLLMVGSASHYDAVRHGQSRDFYLMRQFLYLGVGALVMMVAINIPYRKLAERRWVVTAVLASLVSLVAVLASPAVNGAHRWIPLGPANIQPSEFVKLVVVLYMAELLARREDRVNEFWEVPFQALAVLVPLAFLVVIEPDLGSAIMMAAVAGIMIFVAGLRWRYVAAAVGLGVVGLAVGIAVQSYRIQRLLDYLRPDAEFSSISWQLGQSYVALGSGGLTGVGFAQGQQQAYFLPEAHTDFIFAVVGEEFGLIGTLLVLVAFMLLFWRGLRAATRAPDRFGFYLALGVTCLLVLQGLVNMGVCVGLLPTKGLALPFLSYGGSSLLSTLAGVGILLNVSQHSN